MSKADWDALAAVDFYSRANKLAKAFCKAHPDADRELVYYAAVDAADKYERSEKLRKQHFETIVRMYIRTALLKKRKENEEMWKKLPEGTRDEVMRLTAEGVSTAQIAAKLGIGTSTVTRIRAREKETPAPVPADTDEEKEVSNKSKDIIPPPEENVKPPEMNTVDVIHALVDTLRADDVNGLRMIFRYREREWRVSLEEVNAE